MRKVLWVVLFAALPCVALAAHHKPGLWEGTSQMQFVKGGPQIPPELQAEMKRRGLEMPFNEAHTFKHCVTPEEAARDEHPEVGSKNCTVKGTWSGDSFHGEVVCRVGGHPSHGVFDATLHGGESYAGTMHVEGNEPELGGDYVMEGKFSGKWIGASCGKEGS